MLDYLTSKEQCTACGVCVAVCPKGCIVWDVDEKGFVYPSSSGECINCGLCKTNCIKVKQSIHTSYVKKAFAVVSKDKTIWQNSSSGGAFSELCRVWDNGNTVFVGAAWNDLSVKHKIVYDFSHINLICKSKYIWSDIDGVYWEIRKILDDDIRVVFCGTPCQVAALNTFLGKRYDNLLLIDFICHGVGSENVFRACIRRTELSFGKKIKSYEFRYKEKVYEKDYLIKITFDDDTTVVLDNDRYMQLFLKGITLRPACENNCPYKTLDRISDITIADCRGLEKIRPKYAGKKKNYSTVIANTEKGINAVQALDCDVDIFEYPLEDVDRYNPRYTKQTGKNELSDTFFQEFSKDEDGCIDKWTKDPNVYKRGVIRFIYDCLPERIRHLIKMAKE